MTDESNIFDWTKLDGAVTRIAKSFCFTPSMFGTFDFDVVAGSSQAVEKQRRVRRKTELGIEKRPVAVTQSETAEKQITKVEQVYKIIEEVNDLSQSYGQKFVLNV